MKHEILSIEDVESRLLGALETVRSVCWFLHCSNISVYETGNQKGFAD